MRRLFVGFAALSLCFCCAAPAQAAAQLDGAHMSGWWALPFVGILLTIASAPLLVPRIWHHHYGKIAASWALATLLGIAVMYGPAAALDAFLHAIVGEYMSFIILLLALYTVAGGILVTGNVRGTPLTNTVTLALGTLFASCIGTTGASMVLIRPLIRANDERRHNVHVVVFFIFLVSNIGGALSPLGDPPLFVGFLRGVDFFWPLRNLLLPTALVVGLVLATFFVLDTYLYRREEHFRHPRDKTPPRRLRVSGLMNVFFIAAIIALVLMSSAWDPGITLNVGDVPLKLQNLLRDAALLGIAAFSVWLTPEEHREANGYSWEPIKEVAKLFAAIFICIGPVLAILQAGTQGAFAPLLKAVTTETGTPNNVAYFWLSGSLSAFLDNAPTYLVFFQLAGGDAAQLMGPLSSTLAAISLGAVFMGALTYIGNAPNLMVDSIARERGIAMPSFFGYMAWAVVCLLPAFAVLTVVWVR